MIDGDASAPRSAPGALALCVPMVCSDRGLVHIRQMLSQASTSAAVQPAAATLAPAQLSMLRRDAATSFAVLACVALAFAISTGFGPGFVARTLVVFGIAFALMLCALPTHAPHARFGAANRVTLARLMMIALLAAGVGETALRSDGWGWVLVVVATTTALLDAVDGPLARGSGLASTFGARFDMESDAFLVLVLSLLVMWLDKAGAWILAAGLMRYAFVAAARTWTWLAQPLPPSLRRKTVCVVQIVCLIVCLAPIIGVGSSQPIAAASLALLCASFGADIGWLSRNRSTAAKETP